jgi:hypothetical protein
MAAILAGNNVEEEHLWSCTLTAKNNEFIWDPEGETKEKEGEESEAQEGKKVKPSHRLLIKSAVLMPSANDEVTMVQVESDGYNKAKVTVPICAMQGGTELQKYLDLLVPAPPATLKIISGEGPIHLIGSHCVDYYGFKEDDDEFESEDEADEEMETDNSEKGDDKKTPSKAADEDKTPSKAEDVKKTPSKSDGKKTPVKDGSAKKETPKKA